MAHAGAGEGVHRWLPVVAPLVVAALFALFGQPTRAWVLVGIAAVVFVLVAAGLPVGRWVERGAARVAHWLGVVLGLGVGLVLVAAGGLVRLVGRDPLTPRRDRDGGWLPAPGREGGVALASSTFGLEGARAKVVDEPTWRTAARSGVLALGVVALLVLVDLGIGLTWERLTGAGAPLESVQTRMNFTGDQDTVADVRAGLPSMAAYPWADAYFREIQRTPYGYWPFTESRPLGFEGEYVNLDGWTRRTYSPPDLPADAPVVWMFGGSTTWGEGQRDEYTIASHLARIAEEQGTPIRVVNYGQRGWTHFQEMILFEQLLAAEPAPDVAIFYDGANEINAQTLGAKGVPTHTLADQYARILSGSSIQAQLGEDTTPQPAATPSAWTTYAGHSATGKLLRWIRASLDQPAGASTLQGGDEGEGSADGGSEGEDLGTTYVKTVEDAVRAVDVYQRGRRITEFIGDEAGVRTLFFWQPVMAGPAELWANDNVSAPTIDISDALDGREEEVYIDGGHTNELGAEIVAERIWDDLAPVVGSTAGVAFRPRPVQPEPATPTSASRISDAEASLALAVDDPCALEAWSMRLRTLVAADAAESARIGELAAGFLAALASTRPEGAERDVLLDASASVRQQVLETPLDPSSPVVMQLPIAGDPVVAPAIQSALAAVAVQPGC